MKRYTKKDAAGRNYIESVNGALESDVYGRVYGKAINRFAEFEDSDLVPKIDVEELQKAYLQYEETTGIKKAKADAAKEIFEEILKIKGLELHDWEAIAELKKKFEEKYGGSQ